MENVAIVHGSYVSSDLAPKKYASIVTSVPSGKK
ncbi:hypothetical protein GGE07_006560 [Sinorhizobium terangae]|nr:hypothetical protein [Sinorhizobium terangae]